MTEYKVAWSINVDAESPREAAQRALFILRTAGPTLMVTPEWATESNIDGPSHAINLSPDGNVTS